jgi:glycosyltransferase involved in cell wall biosynthesis
LRTNNFDGFGKIIEFTEGLPPVLIESWLSGLYNIASNVTGVKEIILDGINGIVYNNLHQSLLFAINNKEQFSIFHILGDFSLKKFENHIISLFKKKWQKQHL